MPKPDNTTLPPVAVHAAKAFGEAVDGIIIGGLNLDAFKNPNISLAAADASNNLPGKSPEPGRSV